MIDYVQYNYIKGISVWVSTSNLEKERRFDNNEEENFCNKSS